jgi:hypothetical protein
MIGKERWFTVRESDERALAAFGVLNAPAETTALLADNLTIFQLLSTSEPIFPDSPSIAVMLRLAQFRLNAASGEKQKAAEVAAILFREVSSIGDGELRQISEIMALGSVLCTWGVADYVDDWVSLLQQYKRLAESNSFVTQLHAKFEGDSQRNPVGVFGALFAIGASQLSSVARLEHVIDELAILDSRERIVWLEPANATLSDYSVLINSPWAVQQRRENFDAECPTRNEIGCYQWLVIQSVLRDIDGD